MKKLLLIILMLVSINTIGQSFKETWLQPDKYMHASVAVASTAFLCNFYADYPKIKNPELCAVVTVVTACIAKEYWYDVKLYKGKADINDLAVGIAFSCITPYINRIFNKWETKHFYKKK